jgi:short-chain 2-methylacyl-CoA dehydrogenase
LTENQTGVLAIKQQLLGPLCRGETVASLRVIEPQGGSDVAQNKLRASSDGNKDDVVAGLVGEANVLTLVKGTSEVQRPVIARDLLDF